MKSILALLGALWVSPPTSALLAKTKPPRLTVRAVADGGVAPTIAVDAGLTVDAGLPAAPPMTPEVKALVERMQATYETMQDFSAEFEQEYFFKTFKRKQVASGKLTYKKAALMRWEYLKPTVRTLVLAGDRVYLHDPDAKTLTRAPMSTNQLSASVTFLWGQGNLAKEFTITQKACAACTGTQLELVPLKVDPRFQKLLLELDPATARVIKSVVVDPDGSTNTITYKSLVTNTGVGEAFFKLTPPPGTQVQDFMKGAPTPTTAASGDGGVN